jgi:RimJ/RimL family protein N-acetyltransferase
VHWRPVVPSDRDVFAAGVAKLSLRTRYLRFHSAAQHLPDAVVDELFNSIDQDRHIALAFFAGPEPIAVCRVVHIPDEPASVDVAVTVVDEWQGRGAGAQLLRQTLDLAGDVKRIDTLVLAENRAALRMLQSLGELHLEGDGSQVRAVVTLRQHVAA